MAARTSGGKTPPPSISPATAGALKRLGDEVGQGDDPQLAAHLRIGQVTAIDTATVTATVAYGAGSGLVAIAGHHWLKGAEPAVNDYVQVFSQDGDNWIVGVVATAMAASVAAKVTGPTGTTAVGSLTSCFADLSDVAVTWGTEVQDDGGLWTAGSPSRLTVPAGYGGWWLVGGRIHFSGNTGATGNYRFAVTIRVNGSNKGRSQPHETVKNYPNGFIWEVHDLLPVAAGDYFELFGFQDSGASMSILTTVGEASNSFYAIYQRP